MKRTVRPKRRPPTRKPKGRQASSATPAVWDRAARWYDSLVGLKGSDYQQSLVMPGALALLDLKKKDRVLDLGCGQGVFSRYLNKHGFNVEGLDVSTELIGYARDRSPRTIKFHAFDAADPKALVNETFDRVVCLLAIQNMEHLVEVFRNVARWLKPDGRFVMVLTHPCFRIPRQTHWGFDDRVQIQYRRIDRYASEETIPILSPPMAHSKNFTLTYHRPLTGYFKAFAEAGLVVDRLEEWNSGKTSQPGKRSKAENRAREEIPLFMALRALPLPQEKK